MSFPEVLHHGATRGVTGSCHELRIDEEHSLLIDCGLFQGEEGPVQEPEAFPFSVERVHALVVTHVHIDHVGRIPYLIGNGFDGPIYCSEPSAQLLPLVMEDAIKIGWTRDRKRVERFIARIRKQIVSLPYNRWRPVGEDLKIRLQKAGHILGSAYVECDAAGKKIVFSGDLGAPHTPLIPTPRPPQSADLLILESTYGDRCHEGRKERKKKLREVVERALGNRGAVLIPAFSMGRTQELLYELEEIVHRQQESPAAKDLPWNELEIIVDSPLAARFTKVFRKLKPYWDAEARVKLTTGRHPLSFDQITTIDNHRDHLSTVDYVQRTGHSCIVLAAGGMCNGGRIVNYLRALLGDPRTDILFVGYQARGTLGRDIQQYGPAGGYVRIDGQKVVVKAGVHTIGGYSAHADQKNLLDFVSRMKVKPEEIRLVHGDKRAKEELKVKLEDSGLQVRIP